MIIPATLNDSPATEFGAWAADAGFDAVDAEMHHDATFAGAMRNNGLRFGPMRIRASLADSDQRTRTVAVETAMRHIDRAVELGVTTAWTLPRNFRNDASSRENFAAAIASLREIVAHAESCGVRIAIENCPFEGQNPVCTPEAWDALFAAIPSEALGLCLDPSHCVWQGIDYLRAVREYSPRLYHVHAKDTEILPEGSFRYGIAGPQLEEPDSSSLPGAGWWRHRLPGSGDVDWIRFLTVLDEVGYGGMVSVENEDPLWAGGPERVRQGLAESARYLNGLLRHFPERTQDEFRTPADGS